MSCYVTTSKEVTTALNCSQSRMNMTMFGRDTIAFTVNNLNAKVNMENSARCSTDSRQVEEWTRGQERLLHSKTYKTANRGGPSWSNVAYRVTADASSGDVINIEDATNINHDEDHRLVEGRGRAIW